MKKEKTKTVVLKISDNTKKEMIDYFKYKKREKTPPYAVFQADEMDTVVTLYNSNKVVFQGISADIDANMWREREKHLNPNIKDPLQKEKTKKEKKEEDTSKYYYSSSIGSDEVGTGDFYGPIVVASSFVKKEDIPFLEELGVKDSKKMDDNTILKIVPQIIKKIPYSCIILNNDKFNEIYEKYPNLNKIKAILHNKVLLNLSNKFKADYIIVDQFTPEKKYYDHLKKTNNIQRNIVFVTKGEDKSLAVACGSLISRYVLLKEYDKLNKKYKMKFPRGAGNNTIDFGANFVKEYGIKELEKICKINFKNFEEIKKLAKS